MPHTTITARSRSRRQFLGGVTAGAAAAILAACGGSSPTNAPSTTVGATGTTSGTTAMSIASVTSATATPKLGATIAAPTTMLVDGQIPSGVAGVPDAFTKAPTPYKAIPMLPGKGGKISVFCIAYQPPALPRAENRYWQELEKRLGVTWEPILAPSASYGEKSAALVAGGDLPDLFYLNPDQSADAQRRLIQDGAFTDLTPFLSGDGLKEFPNLARYPDYLWKNAAFRGKIYGVPKPVLRSGNIGFYRSDWLKKLNLAYPKNADDTYNMMVTFAKNDPDGNGQPDTYGTGSSNGGWNLAIWKMLFRQPNNWQLNPDGTLTRDIETEAYRQTIEFAQRLYAGGAYHPDSAGTNNTQERDLWWAGRLGIHNEGFIAFWGSKGAKVRIREAVGPQADIDGFIPPGFDGGKGTTYNMSGYFGFTAIPVSKGKDRERVKELLRTLDYIAAPFGSEEYNFLYYGIDGWDCDVQADGSRVVNDRGRSERGDLVYCNTSEYSFYYPGAPGDAEKAQILSKQSLALGVDDPTLGLISPTNNAKGAELRQLGIDRTTEIITGRVPLSALDAYIKDWRSRGGDVVRKEFEQAIKDAKM